MGFDSLAQLEDTGTVDRRGRSNYRLVRPLKYECRLDGGGMSIIVPAGYITNLASTPRWTWQIFPPFGIYNRAAIVHDYLCEMRGCSMFLADAIFRQMMADLRVPLWRRVLMYYAVRICHAMRWTL